MLNFIDKLSNKKVDKLIKWVAAIVKDRSWKLFFLLENVNKAWKKSGQWSVMMETVDYKDKTLEGTIRRGLEEEFWIKLNNWEKIFFKDLKIFAYVYDSKNDILIKVELFIYEVLLANNQSRIAKNFVNWEISKVKLISKDSFLEWKLLPIRPWTVEVLLWLTDDIFIIDWNYSPFKFK